MAKKKKNAAQKDWDDVYNDMVSQMKENSKKFPNAISQEEEEKLIKEKKKEQEEKKKHPYQFGVTYAPFYSNMGWGGGVDHSSAGDYGGDFGGGDAGGGGGE
jgi:hypothetical protein